MAGAMDGINAIRHNLKEPLGTYLHHSRYVRFYIIDIGVTYLLRYLRRGAARWSDCRQSSIVIKMIL